MRSFGLPGDAPCGLEIFGGQAELTRVHRAAGFPMHPAIEASTSLSVFDPAIDEMITGGLVHWLWLAPPASSFSPLRNSCASGPYRPADCPEGDERRPEVRKGNALWSRVLYLARLADQVGAVFALEHPASSRAWLLPETQKLCSRGDVSVKTVQWCAYWDDGEKQPPTKRTSKLRFTLPWMHYDGVLRTCSGNHQHAVFDRELPARGGGGLPKQFCEVLAGALSVWCGLMAPRLRDAVLSKEYKRRLREAAADLFNRVGRCGGKLCRTSPPRLIDRWLEKAVEHAHHNGERLYYVTLGVLGMQRLWRLAGAALPGT